MTRPLLASRRLSAGGAGRPAGRALRGRAGRAAAAVPRRFEPFRVGWPVEPRTDGAEAGRPRDRDVRLDRRARSASRCSTDALLASAAASAAALGGPGQWVLALPTHYIAGRAGARPVDRRRDRAGDPAAAGTSTRGRSPSRRPPRRTAALRLARSGAARPRASTPRRATTPCWPRRADSTGSSSAGRRRPPALLARARGAGLRVIRTYGSSETAGGCVYDGVPIGTARSADRRRGGRARRPDARRGLPRRRRSAPPRRFVDERGPTLVPHRRPRRGRRRPAPGARPSDDVIISGGEKVSLDAVERVLHTQPGFDGRRGRRRRPMRSGASRSSWSCERAGAGCRASRAAMRVREPWHPPSATRPAAASVQTLADAARDSPRGKLDRVALRCDAGRARGLAQPCRRRRD